ncbi:MAG TPA: ATP-binding protein, partial [Erythrobacter sp.]|nr:ATP-binding protein [Erythrobacter sp.]
MLGKFSADRLKRRIARINRTLSHPDELASMPELPRQTRDEIDELAANSAQVILRVRNLLEAHSDTTDRLAHEIRTPLTHLDARLVKALETQPDEQVTRRLTEARSEIRRLVSMLESLLDIAWSKARLSDRSMLTPVDMSALVTNLCELYADSAEDAGLVLQWEVEPGVVLDGDEAQLGRLLANLLDNALKYVPRGGTIRVTLGDGPVLVVADDGPGIAE